MTIKLVFCWTDINGYMAACWRALQQTPGIEIFVLAFQASTETSFTDQLMTGIPCRLLNREERKDVKLIKEVVLAESPDVIYLCGWWQKPIRELAFLRELDSVPMIMGMDTPWQGSWRQRLAPWFLHTYLQRMARVVVIGERSWQYAYRLGVKPQKIMHGLCGIDYKFWSSLLETRQQYPTWPRSFLFVGRYVQEKALDILVTAYRLYRTRVEAPWDLNCCGQGSMTSMLHGEPGVCNHGFVQPSEMQKIWLNTGVFVMPSRFDPWPLAIVEAAAAGLPILCTNACGSAVEVVRPGYNGLVVPENDPDALVQGMIKLHQKHEELPIWGQRSQSLAAPYAAEVWAQRWSEMLKDVCLSSDIVRIGA
jgi:glycosyltransferase involved in cell wall biosynthesis